MPDKIKVALLTHAGGAHVSAYLNALAECEECESVVVADPDARFKMEANEVLGDKLKGFYTNFLELLAAEQPAMAIVTLEARLAPPVIDRALEAGCHVFAEKPASVKLSDYEELVKKADSKHRLLMLALANRTNPEVMAARELVESGKLGKIYGVDMHLVADQTRLTRASYQQQWFADRNRAGGGHLIWLGIHWLDLAMYITQSSIVETEGYITNIGGQPVNIEDSATAILKFDNGTLGTMTSGYYLDKGYHTHLQVWGSTGWLRVDTVGSLPLEWYTTTGEMAGTVQQFEGDREPRGYSPFIRAAVRAAAGLDEPPISNTDSLRALQVVHAIYDSTDRSRRPKRNS
jgi:predicted dehydrogenase